MLSQTQSIQLLRSAEKSAADKICDARERRNKRLKEAIESANTEAARFKAERDRQFKEFEAKHLGSGDNVAAKIELDTHVAIKEMERDIAINHDQLIDDILELLFDIKPVVHRNLKFVKKMHGTAQSI